MITHKLLNQVLELSITEDGYFTLSDDNKHISIFQDKAEFEPDVKINLYELAHECKDWAIRLEYELLSTVKTDRSLCDVYSHLESPQYTFYGRTEPEAIFKACQWILERGKL